VKSVKGVKSVKFRKLGGAIQPAVFGKAVQNAECKMQNAKCKVQSAECAVVA
jgi:hypothetical protein